MPNDLPNQTEEILLLLLTRGEKYGREVRNAFQERTGREMPLGSLYTTLDRMEAKGFLESRVGDPDPDRGDRRRKFYKISAPGIKALNALQQITRMPKGGLACE